MVVKRARTRTVHRGLLKQRELRPVLFPSERLDLRRASRFLSAELVRREGQNFKVGVLRVQRDELLVVLVRQASLGGDVHDEAHLSGVLGQLDVLAVDVFHCELVRGLR